MIDDNLREKFLKLCEKHGCTEDEAISELIHFWVWLHENFSAGEFNFQREQVRARGYMYQFMTAASKA